MFIENVHRCLYAIPLQEDKIVNTRLLQKFMHLPFLFEYFIELMQILFKYIFL